MLCQHQIPWSFWTLALSTCIHLAVSCQQALHRPELVLRSDSGWHYTNTSFSLQVLKFHFFPLKNPESMSCLLMSFTNMHSTNARTEGDKSPFPQCLMNWVFGQRGNCDPAARVFYGQEDFRSNPTQVPHCTDNNVTSVHLIDKKCTKAIPTGICSVLHKSEVASATSLVITKEG